MDAQHVARLLRARYSRRSASVAGCKTRISTFWTCCTHFEALELQEPPLLRGVTPALIDARVVRSRYKSLAVRVHPDKNRCAGAEEAFKRLSVAYDCLSVDSSQREYLVALQRSRGRSSGAAPAPPSSSQPPVRRRHKRKRAANAPAPDDAAPSARQRTPEEIWREFQREEEELARREFLAKGFERVYHEPKRRERSATPSPPSNSPSREQEEVLATDLDAKATHWATWTTRPAKAGGTEEQFTSSPPDNGARQEPPDQQRRREPTPLVCCLLCRRKFATREQLERHNAQSTLHATNMAKAAAQERVQASEQRQ